MSRFSKKVIPSDWKSSGGSEPAPPKPPPSRSGRRSGSTGDPGRPTASGPWMVVLAMLFVTALLFTLPFASGGGKQVEYSFFRNQLESGDAGNVKSVTFIEGTNKLTGEWKEPPEDPTDKPAEGKERKKLPKAFSTYWPPVEDKGLIPLLQERHVLYSTEPSAWGPGANLIVTVLIFMAVIGFVWFM